MRPDFEVGKETRTRGGALPTSVIQRIRLTLLGKGFVLLPSDTCYSLAAIARDRTVHDNVNAILDRKREPISLAFPSYLHIQQFAEVDTLTAALLERFSPGPITVVCQARPGTKPDFLTYVIASERNTIGVRIPDSFVERDVAACTPYPVTTVAVREPGTGEAVRDFARAVEIVGAGIRRFGGAPWGAVEGEIFYHRHSTVVEVVGGDRRLRLLREGDLPFTELLRATLDVPGLAMETRG